VDSLSVTLKVLLELIKHDEKEAGFVQLIDQFT
jgi:hypothetical protein